MKNLLFRNLVLLMFFIFIFCKSFTNNSKSNVKFTNKNFNNYEIIDSIIGDFNFDFKSDIIRILKNKDQKVRFELYENGNKKALISSEKLIFNYGYLKPYELDFITLSFENKTILISQEYGTTNPNGWYETYISYNQNIKSYIVDSISNNYKVINGNYDVLVKSKSKKINRPLRKLNLILEFEKL